MIYYCVQDAGPGLSWRPAAAGPVSLLYQPSTPLAAHQVRSLIIKYVYSANKNNKIVIIRPSLS